MIPLECFGELTAVGLAAIAGIGALAAWAGAQVGNFRGFESPQAEFEFDGGGKAVALDRGRRVRGTMRLPKAVARSRATVTVRVVDSFGRVLVDGAAPAAKAAAALREIPINLAIPAVVAQRHYLNVTVRCGEDVYATRSEFIYRLPVAWDDYLPTLWHRPTPKTIRQLREICLAGAQWMNSERRLPDHFIDTNYRYYIEHGFRNVFSPYHRSVRRQVARYHNEARDAFLKDRTNLEILHRNPCLSNPIIREEIGDMFTAPAKMHRDYRPLYYSIADEPGIADQAAAFDFCFSPHCRKAFVKWLRKRYRNLPELNRQWGADYARWDAVRGETTDEALARSDDNFSAFCDHKEFMDDVLCDGYRLARDAIRANDPDGRLGMAGGQGPQATGGWDFWKLSQAFDVHETYYIGNNYELMRSFDSDFIGFHTSWGPCDENPRAELLATWHLFVHGDRGLLLIRPRSKAYIDPEGKLSRYGRTIRSLCRELSGGLGKLRIASQRTDDPIAIYHSQANLRVHWIREMAAYGPDWVKRNSSHERIDNRYVRVRESWVKLVEDNGLQYRFICPPQVNAGELKSYKPHTGAGYKVLLLPEILTLSRAEVRAIRAFVRAGGTVIADKLPGEFDAHGKRLKVSPLADLFVDGAGGRAILLNRDLMDYHLRRLDGREGRSKNLLGGLLAKAVGKDRSTPIVTGRGGKAVTGVEVTAWRNGDAQLIALQRNPLMRADEMGPKGHKSNRRLEKPVRLTVRLSGRRDVYNVRTGERLGVGREVSVTLGPWEPVFLLAAPPRPRGAGKLAVEVDVAASKIRISPGHAAGLETPIYHLDFIGPDGKERLVYRQNVTVDPAGESITLPIALNDQPGQWTLAIREVATGQITEVPFEV